MKKKIVLSSLFLFTLLFLSFNTNNKLPYLNSKLPVEERVKDLMSRMTLEEKIAQMCQYVGLEHIKENEKNLQLNK